MVSKPKDQELLLHYNSLLSLLLQATTIVCSLALGVLLPIPEFLWESQSDLGLGEVGDASEQ